MLNGRSLSRRRCWFGCRCRRRRRGGRGGRGGREWARGGVGVDAALPQPAASSPARRKRAAVDATGPKRRGFRRLPLGGGGPPGGAASGKDEGGYWAVRYSLAPLWARASSTVSRAAARETGDAP